MKPWRFCPPIRSRGFFNLMGGALGFVLLGLPAAVGAHGRHPAPVIREVDFAGKPYLSLEDLAQAIKARLRTHPDSKRVDLSFRAHQFRFFMGSDKVTIDGQGYVLDAASVDDKRGSWVVKSFFKSGPMAALFAERIDLGPAETAVKPLPQAPKTPAPIPELKPLPMDDIQISTALPDTVKEPVVPPHVIRRIVIDPGHGGKDPGAMSAKGTQEKDINLWMGQELAETLREKDFEVLLTRTDDTFIPLAERAALANRHKADLFISVHCNASLSPKLSGFEVYILAERASDSHAAAVARLENASLELEGKTPSAPVQAVLRSLVKNANINTAAQLGSIMDREVAEQLAQSHTRLQQAPFYVLRGAQMPAVLIELGFLSNKTEERQLLGPAYRRKMIKAIEASILEFDKKQREGFKKG